MSMKRRGHHHPSHPSHAELPESSATKPAAAEQKIGAHERSRLIDVRAYDLWEQAGRPHSDESRQRFWCAAEKEVMGLSCAD
jgi:DUF2934 family protein